MNEREGADGKGDGEGYGDGCFKAVAKRCGADGSNSDGSGRFRRESSWRGNAPSQKPIEKVADSEFLRAGHGVAGPLLVPLRPRSANL